MTEEIKRLCRQIENYVPVCEQEEADRKRMLDFMELHEDCLLRTNLTAHFTASSWIVSPDRKKVLMVYHNIYDSWAWTGGHADGEADLLAVALREAEEETGISRVRPLSQKPVSLEILTVDGHEKRGVYVPSHLHMNLTYLLEADENQQLSVREEENSGVRWIPAEELSRYVSEPWMLERIYSKLTGLNLLTQGE
ncbi:MAG: NUDIX hydrolase [Emergencia sp.]